MKANNIVKVNDKVLDKAIIEESKKKTTGRKNKLPVILEPEEVQNLLKQPSKRYPTG